MSSAAARFASQAKKSAGAKPRKTTRFGGVKAGGDRNPRPQCGLFRFKYISGGEGEGVNGKDPYFKAVFEVVESGHDENPVGSLVHFDQCINAKSMAAAGPKLKAMAMAFLGTDEETYERIEIETCGEDGSFLEAVLGNVNAFGENPLGGCEAYAQVSRGNATSDGDFYRNFNFAPVDDDSAGE